MSHRARLLGATVWIATIFSASPLWGAELIAPCIWADSAQEYAKLKAKGPHAGERLCKHVIPELKKLIEDMVRERAELYYNGCELDAVRGTDRPQCLGRLGNDVPKETCNSLDTPGVPKTFNRIVEKNRNHNFDFHELKGVGFADHRRPGAECGRWPLFRTRISGKSCKITPEYAKGGGFIEDSYNRGAFIQALNCFHQQVQFELDKGKVLLTMEKVPDDTGAVREQEGPCAVMARLYQEQKAGTERANNLNLGTAENLEEIEQCTGDEKIDSTQLNSDRGRLRQSACQLKAARDALEKAFAAVAACEIGLRAGNSYVGKFIGTGITHDEIARAAFESGRGRKGKSRQCNHKWVLNKFYIPTYTKRFKTKAEAIWNATTCGPRN
ncbi:MAG: hypothetical protein NDJ89_16250 [Oligoflexia bacterium]|nr:hypothetical protein [Oligoflexia bacterium]